MNRFMATRSPAGALLEAQSMVRPADENPAAVDLLEVALHTEVRVANCQQLGVHRPVRRMTDCAAFAHGFVLKHVGTALRRVAGQAAFVRGG